MIKNLVMRTAYNALKKRFFSVDIPSRMNRY